MLTNLEIKFEGRDFIPKTARCSEHLEWVPNLPLKRFMDHSLYIDEQRFFKKRLIVTGTGSAPNLDQIPKTSVLEVKTGIRIINSYNKSQRIKIKMITINYQIKIDDNGNIAWTWQLEEI
jgi:hypothetical protein